MGEKMTKAHLDHLRYAERNHGRTFIVEGPFTHPDANAVVNELGAMGLVVDGGPSASGRWRNLTPAGRQALREAGK